MNAPRPWRFPPSLLCGNQADASRNPLAPAAIMVFMSTHLEGEKPDVTGAFWRGWIAGGILPFLPFKMQFEMRRIV